MYIQEYGWIAFRYIYMLYPAAEWIWPTFWVRGNLLTMKYNIFVEKIQKSF